MTDEQLKRGEELKTQINRLRGKIDHWKKKQRAYLKLTYSFNIGMVILKRRGTSLTGVSS